MSLTTEKLPSVKVGGRHKFPRIKLRAPAQTGLSRKPRDVARCFPPAPAGAWPQI